MAANQKTAREPVMNLDAGKVQHALRQLEGLGLARQHFSSRAERYEHLAGTKLDLPRQQVALLGLLQQRGLVVQLPRAGGQREDRFMHLMGGPLDLDALAETYKAAPAAVSDSALEARVQQLEATVAELQEQLAELKAAVGR